MADGDDYGGCFGKEVDCVAGCRVYFDEILSGRFLDEEVQRGDIGRDDGIGIIGAYARGFINGCILINDGGPGGEQVVEEENREEQYRGKGGDVEAVFFHFAIPRSPKLK